MTHEPGSISLVLQAKLQESTGVELVLAPGPGGKASKKTSIQQPAVNHDL